MFKKVVRFMSLVLFTFSLSSCGGGGGSSGESGKQIEVLTEIESFTSQMLESDPPSFEVVVRFSNNVSRVNARNIGVKVVVATDGNGDGMGDDFAFFYNMDCLKGTENCDTTNYYFTYSYADIVRWCCVYKRDISYVLTNVEGYLQLTMRYHGKFTKNTYDNLVGGNVLTNIETVLFSGASKEAVLSRDYYPVENQFTDQLGQLSDNIDDYEGSSNLIDIHSVTIINHFGP